MQIMVCIKQILDPETPPKEFKIDPQTNRPVLDGQKLVLDSYAENALEMALQLRDQVPGSKVTVLCLGDKPADEVMRRALSFTADAAARAWDPAWSDLDGQGVAHVLAQSIQALGGADLVLTGREAGDVEEGLVGPSLAEELGMSCITLVAKVEVADGAIVATREAEGFVKVRTSLPAVLTVTSSETNLPRLPKVKDVMMSRSKPIKLLGAADVSTEPARVERAVKLERAYIPVSDVQCEILSGDDGPTKAGNLVRRLQELKVL